MPGVIYRCIAVTVVVSKRWIDAGGIWSCTSTFAATLSGICVQTAHVSTANKVLVKFSSLKLASVTSAFQSEKQRWSQTIVEYQKQEKTLCGDVLVASAFVSYLGYFTRQYRLELLNNVWIPFLKSQKVHFK